MALMTNRHIIKCLFVDTVPACVFINLWAHTHTHTQVFSV